MRKSRTICALPPLQCRRQNDMMEMNKKIQKRSLPHASFSKGKNTHLILLFGAGLSFRRTFCYNRIAFCLRGVVRCLFCAGSVWRGRFARNNERMSQLVKQRKEKNKNALCANMLFCVHLCYCVKDIPLFLAKTCAILYINRTDRNSVQQLQRRLPYEEIPLRRISADGAHDALHQRAGERTEI